MANKQESSRAQLAPYIKGFKIPFVLAILGALISSIITVIGPDKLSEITDLVTEGLMTGNDKKKVQSIATGLAILYLIGALVSY